MKLRTKPLFDNLNISMLQQLATMVLLTVGLMTLTGCFVGNWSVAAICLRGLHLFGRG